MTPERLDDATLDLQERARRFTDEVLIPLEVEAEMADGKLPEAAIDRVKRGSSMIETPGASTSTRKRVGRRSSPSTTLAITMITEATSPEVTNHFSPLSRKPPAPSGSATALIREGSEPASASVTA